MSNILKDTSDVQSEGETPRLILEIAQLSDVGRMRPHNEDNMAYVIPNDTIVMHDKGALFVVADGMGGHQAGEVASELAIDSITHSYYQDTHRNIAESLQQAFQRANELIHDKATENTKQSGMGTTCVASVIRGDVAYIANIGDSRAYILHNGEIRQITEDHSWVAEQVRAGLLTEEQARTHVQRNVITRSLGTKPVIEADIFSELVVKGDILLLCTDGLSGQLDRAELKELMESSSPQESVYQLIDAANELGGPDNITAIVVRIMEVGVHEEIGYPVTMEALQYNDYDSSHDQYGTRPLPTTRSSPPPQEQKSKAVHSLGKRESKIHGALFSKAGRSIQQELTHPSKLMILLAGLLIILIIGIAYSLIQQSSSPNVNQQLETSSQQLAEAQQSIAQNPQSSLTTLAVTAHTLQQLQHKSITAVQMSTVQQLETKLVLLVREAIQNYNTTMHVVPLSCNNVATISPITNTANFSLVRIITITDNQGNTSIYAFNNQHEVIQLAPQSDGTYIEGNQIAFPGNPEVLDITNDTTQLISLLMSGNTSYSIGIVTSSQTSPQITVLDPNLLHNNEVPVHIAAQGNDVYLLYQSTQGNNDIVDMTLNDTGAIIATTTAHITKKVSQLVALPDKSILLLTQDGYIQDVQFGSSSPIVTFIPIHHDLGNPITINSNTYTANTNVPVPQVPGIPANAVPLQVTNQTALTEGTVNGQEYLYITDTVHARIIAFAISTYGNNSSTPTTTTDATSNTVGGAVVNVNDSITLQPALQYVDASLLTHTIGLDISPTGSPLTILSNTSQNHASWQLTFVTTNTTNCAQ